MVSKRMKRSVILNLSGGPGCGSCFHNAEITCDLGQSRNGPFLWSSGQLAHWSERGQASHGRDKFPLAAFIQNIHLNSSFVSNSDDINIS